MIIPGGKMRKIAVIFCVLAVFGCARVNLQTTEPIKVDVNMRVDIYQHVVEDVQSIEDQIYGDKERKINFLFSLENVYAQDYSDSIAQAIQGRKSRIDIIDEYLQKGYLGENKNADLEIVSKDISPDTKEELTRIVKDENKDRGLIYEYTADKNNADIVKTRKIFFDDHYKRAPGGYWFQVCTDGECNWVQK